MHSYNADSDDLHGSTACPPFAGHHRLAGGVTQTASAATSGRRRELWKLIPGLAISTFFLWRTVRSIHYKDLQSLRVVYPQWIAVLVAALLFAYLLRVYRWWFMLRRSGAPSLRTCGRVLLTSYAANNVLPFRIGDFLRIFSYAGDLGTSSSTILSTVILERLLDVFTLLLFLGTLLLGAARSLPPFIVGGRSVNLLHLAAPVLVLCATGLMLLLFGAHLLQSAVHWTIGRFSAGRRTEKLERWALLLFDAVLKLSFSGRVLLLVSSALIWLGEGMIFVSAARLLDLHTTHRGPWLAVALSNLMFLVPSSPGAVGTYEIASKFAMQSQGAPENLAAIYGLLMHILVYFSVTITGGALFLAHRIARGAASKPLTEDLAALPAELPTGLPTAAHQSRL